MPNRFEQVDEPVDDAITVTLMQRNDGQWATVFCPASATGGANKQDLVTPAIPPLDALKGAVQLANDMKLAIVVIDKDGVWKKEWGELYRWEDQAGEDGADDDGPAAA
jgi:hypothetical protein